VRAGDQRALTAGTGKVLVYRMSGCHSCCDGAGLLAGSFWKIDHGRCRFDRDKRLTLASTARWKEFQRPLEGQYGPGA